MKLGLNIISSGCMHIHICKHTFFMYVQTINDDKWPQLYLGSGRTMKITMLLAVRFLLRSAHHPPMFDSNLLPINQVLGIVFLPLHANMRNYAGAEHLVRHFSMNIKFTFPTHHQCLHPPRNLSFFPQRNSNYV